MNRNLCPKSSGWAVLALTVAALTLAGCGRKGPLELPSTASSPTANSANASAAPSDTAAEAANKPSLFNPSYGTDAAPAATRGKKKPFILDPLLGN